MLRTKVWFALVLALGIVTHTALSFCVGSPRYGHQPKCFNRVNMPETVFRSLRLKSAQSSPSTSTSASIIDWALGQGSKKEDIKVSFLKSTEESSDIFGVAAKDISKGDVIFSLPLGLCIDAEKVRAIFGSDGAITEKKLRTGSLGMLALFLLRERLLGKDSKYHAYIQALPEKAPGVLSWTADALQQLTKSTTRKLDRQLIAVDADCEYLRSALGASPAAGSILPPTEISMESFRWAMGIVKSRYVIVEGRPMLVPGMDSLECDPFATNEPMIGSAGVFGGKLVKLCADRSYTSGARVCMSFGLKSSAESLEDHGVIPNIPLEDSSCEVTVSIDGSEKFAGDKINILEDNGVGTTQRFDLEAGQDVEIDPELIRFLRLKLMSGKDAFILEPCFMNTVFSTLSAPFSRPNELAVFTYMQELCGAELATINAVASEEDDNAVVQQERQKKKQQQQEQQAGGNPDMLMALLRLQERAALKETKRKAEAELASIQGPLDPREYYQERRLRELDLLRPLDDEEVIMPGERAPLDDSY